MSMRCRFLWTVLALAILTTGCGFSDRQPVYPVRGTVLLDGKPFPGGGSIAFVPIGKQAGKTAGGQIGEQGDYVLNTYANGDGSMAGTFRVVIIQEVASDSRVAIPDGQAIPEGGLQGLTVSEEDRIPAGYSDPVNSPLRATVEPRTNVIHFDLKRKLDPPEGSSSPDVAGRSQRRPDRHPDERFVAGIGDR